MYCLSRDAVLFAAVWFQKLVLSKTHSEECIVICHIKGIYLIMTRTEDLILLLYFIIFVSCLHNCIMSIHDVIIMLCYYAS